MKKLEHLALVQFSLYEDQDIPISGNTAFLGLNGCGKSTLLDAIQIVLTGATRLALNSQASATGHRTVRDYCLGVVQQDGGHGTALRLREIALSYIALTFRDEKMLAAE